MPRSSFSSFSDVLALFSQQIRVPKKARASHPGDALVVPLLSMYRGYGIVGKNSRV